MSEQITLWEMAKRLLRLMATQEGASDIAMHLYAEYSSAEDDGDRMTILMLGLRSYEDTLRETRKIAVDLIQKVGPPPIVIEKAAP